jgi:hypothetical protein
MCGRAGWEYDFREDEEGNTEITKTGIKMKAEGDMSFEPSLLIEMEKARDGSGKIGQGIIHRAWVVGDRFHDLTGKSFDNPGFEAFLSHIKKLNLGGEHLGVDTGNSSQELFSGPEARMSIQKRREILLECIQNEITKRIPGRTTKEQQDKIKLLEDTFGTSSWTAISDIHPEKLEAALKKMTATKKESEATNV